MNAINRINREQLKTKLDRGENIKLLMTMNEWAYNSAHIPGSFYFSSPQELSLKLNQDDEIVVYDTGKLCPASMRTYRLLQQMGYRNIHEYDGGLLDWEAAGYPLEGELVH